MQQIFAYKTTPSRHICHGNSLVCRAYLTALMGLSQCEPELERASYEVG